MKVVTETDDQLVLVTTPWLLVVGLIAFTLVFTYGGLTRLSQDTQQGLLIILGSLIFGAIMLIAFARRTTLSFDRTRGAVTRRRRSLVGVREDILDLDDLSNAKLQKTMPNDRRKTGARIALVVYKGPNEGTHPVTRTYSGGSGPSRAVDTINAWLERSQ